MHRDCSCVSCVCGPNPAQTTDINYIGGLDMKSDFLRGCFLALALLLFGSASAFAQEATILGTVTDPSGAAVANVSVTITSLEHRHSYSHYN